jgi:hypothetical protein
VARVCPARAAAVGAPGGPAAAGTAVGTARNEISCPSGVLPRGWPGSGACSKLRCGCWRCMRLSPLSDSTQAVAAGVLGLLQVGPAALLWTLCIRSCCAAGHAQLDTTTWVPISSQLQNQLSLHLERYLRWSCYLRRNMATPYTRQLVSTGMRHAAVCSAWRSHMKTA